jgi:glycosyltransferase involved in cell wall biosynthesis
VARPLVSVIIPAFNAARFLRRAVDSVRAQTLTDWEVIIAEDGSTDETLALARALQRENPNRIRVISQANSGASAARNTGIDAARGDYLAFLDADDEFRPTKLARQMELFDARPELGLVFSDFTSIDLNGGVSERRFDDPAILLYQVGYEEIAPGLRVCGPEFLPTLLRQHFVSPITAVVRRDVIGRSVRFPPGLEYWEERIFILEVARRAPAGYVNEALSINHFVSGSLSRTDTTKNLRHRLRAVEEIGRRLADAAPTLQRIVRQEHIDCLRALAFNRFKAGDYAEAAGLFSRVFMLKPSPRAAFHWIESAVRAWGSRRHAAATDILPADR